jgi:hypothetical protein
MTPKQKARLEKLADYLSKLKPDNHRKFDMTTWFETDVKVKVNPKTGECTTVCGTSACALGHAALIPEFQRAGLKLLVDSEGAGCVSYRGYKGGNAAMEFFGLNWIEASDLFDSRTCTPKKKAEQIRRVLRIAQANNAGDYQ